MALGVQATDVRRMVMMSGLRWLAVGIGIGVPASIALAKILENCNRGIKSADPLTLVAVSLLLTAVGLAACYFPAQRAGRRKSIPWWRSDTSDEWQVTSFDFRFSLPMARQRRMSC